MALDNLKKDASINSSGDSLGGAMVLPSDVYMMQIVVAYLGESTGGAMSLNLHFKSKEGKELRSTIYITSGKAKGQLNTYVGKDNKKHFLPGFELATSLTELVVGTEIGEMNTEKKTINLYNIDAKKELPEEVPMLMDLVGQNVAVAVLDCLDNKNVKDSSGNYVPDTSGETRRSNEVDKFFNEDGLTITEANAGATEPGFLNRWKEKWEGKQRSRVKDVTGGAVSGAPTVNKPAVTTGPLFNK